MITSIPLEAWRATHQLVLAVFDATNGFPMEERFGLCAQMRSAAVALAAHVAQVSARRCVLRVDLVSVNRGWGVVAQLGVLLRQARRRRLLDHAAWMALEAQRRVAARHVWRLFQRPPFAGRTAPSADGQGRWTLDVGPPATTP